MFELPQLRKYVDAVDSPVGPEVQQQQLPAKIGEAEASPAGMYPVHTVREVGSAHGGTIH